MDWLGYEQRGVRGPERTFLENPAEWLQLLFGGGASATGKTITPMTAMRSSGVFASVRNIAEDLGSLPFLFYERVGTGNGKRRATEHPMYELLHIAPNDEMDAMQFVETMQAWSDLWPCAYAEQVRDLATGETVAFWPIHPDLVKPLRINGQLVYRIQLPAGQTTPDGSSYRILDRSLIFKLRNLSLDGVSGLGTVATMTEPIALALALEEHGARFFGQGTTPGGMLEHPAKLGDEAYKRLKTAFEHRHQGLSNSHRLAILEEGMKWHEPGAQNDKAQFIESRKFQLEEAARIYRVAPHKIGHLDRSTNNNIEHQGIEHVQDTLRPRAVRWEKAFAHQVLLPSDRKRYFAEFLLDALMRGDSKSRAETLAIKRQNGVINGDEWRELDNMNPLPNGQGEAYLVQVNMTTLEKVMAPALEPPPAAPGLPPANGGASPPPPAQEERHRALFPLLEDQMGRALRRHSKAIAAAVRKHDLKAFEAWAADYFQGEVAELRGSIERVTRALLELAGADGEAASTHAAAAASRYCRLAVDQVGDVVRRDPAGAAAAVDQLAARWAEPAEQRRVAAAEFEQAIKLVRAGAPAAA